MNDKKDEDLYEKLNSEEMLKHKGGPRTRKEQFLTAMAIGFKNKRSITFKVLERLIILCNCMAGVTSIIINFEE